MGKNLSALCTGSGSDGLIGVRGADKELFLQETNQRVFGIFVSKAVKKREVKRMRIQEGRTQDLK